MRVTETVCDRCGSRKVVSSFGFAVGRRADAAGSMEDIVLGCDLCQECKAYLLDLLVETVSKEKIESFFRSLVGQKHGTRPYESLMEED